MCYNCGCGLPDDDMGSTDNVTGQTIKQLAKEWQKSEPETKSVLLEWAENSTSHPHDPELLSLVQKASNTMGQTVEESKHNIIALLKSEAKN